MSSPALAGEESFDSPPCYEKGFMVQGTSMSPLIKNGEKIEAVMGGVACFAPLRIGDVILFENGSNALPLMKRIYATAGDEFTVKDSKIFVNGQVVSNSQDTPYHINEKRAAMLRLYMRDDKGVMPARTLLVLGDNIGGTDDSSRFGLIHENDVIGKVIRE